MNNLNLRFYHALYFCGIVIGDVFKYLAYWMVINNIFLIIATDFLSFRRIKKGVKRK